VQSHPDLAAAAAAAAAHPGLHIYQQESRREALQAVVEAEVLVRLAAAAPGGQGGADCQQVGDGDRYPAIHWQNIRESGRRSAHPAARRCAARGTAPCGSGASSSDRFEPRIPRRPNRSCEIKSDPCGKY
jgi:hypothetical protein